MQSHSKCLADLCGALHCDVIMNTKSTKTKCNPAATARNRHLCEVALERSNCLHFLLQCFLIAYVYCIPCRVLQIVVFLLIRAPLQAVFMVFFKKIQEAILSCFCNLVHLLTFLLNFFLFKKEKKNLFSISDC